MSRHRKTFRSRRVPDAPYFLPSKNDPYFDKKKELQKDPTYYKKGGLTIILEKEIADMGTGKS